MTATLLMTSEVSIVGYVVRGEVHVQGRLDGKRARLVKTQEMLLVMSCGIRVQLLVSSTAAA